MFPEVVFKKHFYSKLQQKELDKICYFELKVIQYLEKSLGCVERNMDLIVKKWEEKANIEDQHDQDKDINRFSIDESNQNLEQKPKETEKKV
jgi:hypothetical protein